MKFTNVREVEISLEELNRAFDGLPTDHDTRHHVVEFDITDMNGDPSKQKLVLTRNKTYGDWELGDQGFTIVITSGYR